MKTIFSYRKEVFFDKYAWNKAWYSETNYANKTQRFYIQSMFLAIINDAYSHIRAETDIIQEEMKLGDVFNQVKFNFSLRKW